MPSARSATPATTPTTTPSATPATTPAGTTRATTRARPGPATSLLQQARDVVAAGHTGAVSFYRRPGAARLLLLAAVLLFYVGSVPVYYVHAVLRGEQGPRIDHLSHYLLDATLVFVGLTPALALVLPLAHALLRRVAAARPAPFVLLSAVLVTGATAPGPLLHQLVAGRGTPLASLAESAVVGGLPPAQPVGLRSELVAESLVQVAVGFPVYLLLLGVAVALRGRVVLADRAGGRRTPIVPAQRAPERPSGPRPVTVRPVVPAQRTHPQEG